VVDLLTVVALPIAIISAMALFLVYFFMLKPRLEVPLPNEHDEGLWRIPLAQLGLMNEGKVCTGRRYVQTQFAKLIDNSPSSEVQGYIKLREEILKSHIFAQRVGRDKYLYLFDQNPLDPQFHMRDDKSTRLGTTVPIRYLLHIKDCMSGGRGEDGFNYVKVKLKSESAMFSDDEREAFTLHLDTLKNLKLAATGKEEKKHLDDRIGILETHLSKAYGKLNEGTSNQAESELIAATTSLTHPEVQPPSRFHWPKATEFFTGWQVAIAIIAYLVTPNAMAAAGIAYPDRQTVAVGMAFFLFLAFPFVRKLIHR
jgi:hypothetical protein